jgi:hypothetical protein
LLGENDIAMVFINHKNPILIINNRFRNTFKKGKSTLIGKHTQIDPSIPKQIDPGRPF